ncbi:MAG: hypothetical protein JWP80_1487 [Pseudomonas sp.]|nr:hypothetical protein [Pseudomonas sp.]
MSRVIELSVSFPKFGKNYYSQEFVFRRKLALIDDQRFAAFLMPSASNHFSNEVVGLNDQFRFLNNILFSHLTELQDSAPAKKTSRVVNRNII